MNPFKNLQINLLAKQGWAVVAVFAICITFLGLFGQGELANKALTSLITVVSVMIGAMAMWAKD